MRSRSQSNLPLNDFHLFPLLPPELRLKIWHLSIPQTPLLLPRQPISCLSVSQESRATYLKTYSLCFHPIVHTLLEYPISLYANYELDILYMDPDIDDVGIWRWRLEDWLVPRAIEGLERVAVEDDYWRDLDPVDGMARVVNEDEVGNGDGEVDLRFKLSGFQALKELCLVLTSTDPMDEEEEEEEDEEEDEEGKPDQRSLVFCERKLMEDDYVVDDVYAVFEYIEERRPEWVAPELRTVRMVYI